MRAIFLFLAFASAALAAIPARLATMRQTTTPQADLLFYWSAQTLYPEYLGFASKMGSSPLALFGGATNTGGYVVVPNVASSFPCAFYNANSSGQSGFGYITKGMLQFTWQYDTTVNNNVMLSELAGKSNGGGGPGDSNDGLSVITVNSGGGESIQAGYAGNNGVTSISTPVMALFSPVAATDRRARFWWSSYRLRTLILQDNDNPPVTRISPTGLPVTVCPQWNQFLAGNDTPLAMGFKTKEYYIYGETPPQITGSFWQDFNFSGTVNAANLGANDHANNFTWATFGTVNFDTNTDAKITSPMLINNQVDSGTFGLRRDINATAAGGVYTTITAVDNAITYTFALRNAPNLSTAGTGVVIAFVADSVGGANIQSRVSLYDASGGADAIYLQDGSGAGGTAILYTPGNDYWISVETKKNSASRILVKTTAGQIVGSATLTNASNRDGGILAFGSFDTNTSQTAGTKVRYSNLIFSTYYDTLPNDGSNWPYDVFTP